VHFLTLAQLGDAKEDSLCELSTTDGRRKHQAVPVCESRARVHIHDGHNHAARFVRTLAT
jgi:hypothetical protein